MTAQFRCGILPLRIETGRFRNLPVEERICELCNLRQVEDEQHFLCDCPKYEELRLPLLRKANEIIPLFNTLSKKEQLVSLMTNLWREVSFYLENAWNLRKDAIFQ